MMPKSSRGIDCRTYSRASKTSTGLQGEITDSDFSRQMKGKNEHEKVLVFIRTDDYDNDDLFLGDWYVDSVAGVLQVYVGGDEFRGRSCTIDSNRTLYLYR